MSTIKDFAHAQRVAHHLATSLGSVPGIHAHGSSESLFRGLDDDGARRKLVAVCETFRANSSAFTGQLGKDLLLYADSVKRELAEQDAVHRPQKGA